MASRIKGLTRVRTVNRDVCWEVDVSFVKLRYLFYVIKTDSSQPAKYEFPSRKIVNG